MSDHKDNELDSGRPVTSRVSRTSKGTRTSAREQIRSRNTTETACLSHVTTLILENPADMNNSPLPTDFNSADPVGAYISVKMWMYVPEGVSSRSTANALKEVRCLILAKEYFPILLLSKISQQNSVFATVEIVKFTHPDKEIPESTLWVQKGSMNLTNLLTKATTFMLNGAETSLEALNGLAAKYTASAIEAIHGMDASSIKEEELKDLLTVSKPSGLSSGMIIFRSLIADDNSQSTNNARPTLFLGESIPRNRDDTIELLISVSPGRGYSDGKPISEYAVSGDRYQVIEGSLVPNFQAGLEHIPFRLVVTQLALLPKTEAEKEQSLFQGTDVKGANTDLGDLLGDLLGENKTNADPTDLLEENKSTKSA